MKNDVPSNIMNKLFENGYEEQLIDIMMECENATDKVVSDIPLSTALMQDSGTDIIMTATVFEQYKLLIQRANSELPVEIPFILLGNHREIDGKDTVVFESLRYGYTDESQLKDNSVALDESIFDTSITTGCSVVSIGHTHPNVSEERKKTTLASGLSDELKEKLQIRDVGLNLSVADIWQQEYWKQRAKDKGFTGQVLQTIIMYNGDVIVIDDQTVSKSNSVVARTESNTFESISTGISYDQLDRKM